MAKNSASDSGHFFFVAAMTGSAKSGNPQSISVST